MNSTPSPGRGPSPISLSDLKGCAAPAIVILVMVLITCVMELRRRERAELHLLKVMDSVQTDLEKGRVRQALDTLHVEFHNMEVSE